MSVITESYRETARRERDVVDELRRLTEPAYDDGVSEPRQNDPTDPDYVDAAEIAFRIFSQGERSIENGFDLSALWIFWGQFLDHDLDLSPEQQSPNAELLKDDTSPFDFDVVRSAYQLDEDGVAQQLNVITPFIDASNVYGSSLELQDLLRTGSGGLLKTSVLADGSHFLPTSDQLFGGGDTGTYVAGDVRAQENTALTALHATFVNEHNYWAARIAAADPTLSDEDIFQQARTVVEALIQRITYEEFLPFLLGDALPAYAGHDPALYVQISTEFSTAAYRFGHTAIPEEFTFLAEDGSTSRAPANLFEVFNDATTLEELGIDDTLRGLLEARSQEIDTLVVDSLNFFLFTPDGGLTGFSLPERNILRGRDHGIDTYLSVREQVLGDVDAAALEGSGDFSVITTDAALQAALAAVYGTVDKVDLWVGGLAEDHAPGVTIGATFQAILVEQFALLRDGDPLFYLNRDWASDAILEEILDTRLSDILMRSAGVDHVQRDALLASDRIGGTAGDDKLAGGDGRDLLIGFAGKDHLDGRGGDDDLFGDLGNDKLSGGDGNDALSGGAGRDKLDGGAGDDILAGGDGADDLIGGPGSDRFVFIAGEAGIDVILDFHLDEDRIVMKYFDAWFADIAIDFARGATWLSVHGTEFAQLKGRFDALDADDFIFVA